MLVICQQLTLQQISNVDTTNLLDGSVLQYNSTSGKFVGVNDLHNTGSFTINGGNFKGINNGS